VRVVDARQGCWRIFAKAAGAALEGRSRDEARRIAANTAKAAGVADGASQMKDQVYTVEWSREAKEFRVVKVAQPKDGGWSLYDNYWHAHAVAVRWNEALRRHYSTFSIAGKR
jgi:hypothetical protein